MLKITSSKLSDEDIQYLLEHTDMSLTRVLDNVIKMTGTIGVGLITLAENVSNYIKNHDK